MILVSKKNLQLKIKSLILFMCCINIANAQKIKYFNSNHLGYGIGNYSHEYLAWHQVTVTDFGIIEEKAYNTEKLNFSSLSIKTVNGVIINNKATFGLAIGLENYNIKEDNWKVYNFLPISAEALFFIKNYSNNSFFLGLGYGYGIRINSKSQPGGALYDTSIGYKVRLGKRSSPQYSISLGYSVQQLRANSDIEYIKKPKLESLKLKVGIHF